MHNDLGTFSLWMSLGAALIIGGIQTAGWKHRALIYGLIAAGSICVLMAIAWPAISNGWPSLARFMSASAVPSSWFTLLVFAAALIIFLKPPKADHLFSILEKVETSLREKIGKTADEVSRSHSNNQAALTLLGARVTTVEDVVANAISEMKQLVAIDLPNASTVAEAFKNLDDATKVKIDRIHDEVQRISAKDSAIHWDLLRLLDWARSRASALIISELIGNAPELEELECSTMPHIRDEQMKCAGLWLHDVQSRTELIRYGSQIADCIINSKFDGETMLRQLPIENRPDGIDPYVFRDFFVTAHQCNLVKKSLAAALQEIDRAEPHLLQFLNEQYTARKPSGS